MAPLPPNITFSASGLLSGIPTVSGTFSPRIKVTDALNRSAEQTFTLLVAPTCALLGDLNCDGVVNFDDIDPFVSALGAEPLAWNLAHPRCHWLNADCNGDGVVDFDDIDPFVALLGN